MRVITHICKHSKEINWANDIITGIVIALVSIPIAMGYAQIAGLPVVYGLYGSLLPVLVYAFLTTSPQFVIGVDAMPAAMVGALLAQFGIASESDQAKQLVPVIACLVAIWFLVFYVIKAGRVVKYISLPVMGGFISGVGLTIILMQIPKLFGGKPGTGEVFILLEHIYQELVAFHPLSMVLGLGTIIIILLCKKFIPKIPMTVVMMGVGALLQAMFHLDQYGVKTLPSVESGLPGLILPNLHMLTIHTTDLIMQSLSIAAVIMAQTLLATGSYAMKYGDEVDNNAELIAFAGMNLAGGLVGCCPINGSVSRSGIADSMGCRSQIMSITSALTMVVVLLFGTPFLKYLPVPVLTGIVMTALIGILDFKMVRKLWDSSRNEFIIFMLAFAGVLIFGTVYGVMIGVMLSFMEVAIRAVNPPTTFVGRIPNQGNYHSLNRNYEARPIQNTVIYRFSGNLFFANIDRFQNDLEQAIQDSSKQVVVDARGIGSIDITAAERLLVINKNLQNKGIRFYITEHDGSLNDQLRSLGAESLLEEGVVRKTITMALLDAGVEKPFDLEEDNPFLPSSREKSNVQKDVHEVDTHVRSEFEWLFGQDAEEKIRLLAESTADEFAMEGNEMQVEEQLADEHGFHTKWGLMTWFDEDEFLDFLEVRLEKLVSQGKIKKENMEHLLKLIELKRKSNAEKLDQETLLSLKEHQEKIRSHIKEKYPKEYEHIKKIWNSVHNLEN